MTTRWESDACPTCVWDMEIINGEWLGTAVTECEYHKTLDEALYINRFKNNIIGTICEALNIDILAIIDPTADKNITFDIMDDGNLMFNLKNFSQEDIDIINNLEINSIDGLNINITTV